MENKLIPMNLQFFAEEVNDENVDEINNETSKEEIEPKEEGKNENVNEEKKFTQADVDRLINERLARENKKKSSVVKVKDDEKKEDKVDKEKIAITKDLHASKVMLALAKSNVESSKLERASRLVDVEKCLDNGKLDIAKLDAEIKEVLSEFPELLKKNDAEDTKGFKFGADSQGNTKTEKAKPLATKKWNKFN